MTDEVTTTHTVFTDALSTLGKIIDETAQRDAIHLAVEPAQAGITLYAGQDVRRLPDGRYGPAGTEPRLGIVDPFLTKVVRPDDWFWLVLPPRQITSLRHVWEHPAFPSVSLSAEQSPVSDKSASERWMRAWAVKHMGTDYYYGGDGSISEDAAYSNAIEAGRNMSVGPYEDARDHIDNEWWSHWEAITGEAGQRGEYFSCAC